MTALILASDASTHGPLVALLVASLVPAAFLAASLPLSRRNGGKRS